MSQGRLALANALVAFAHQGQTDKAGEPYEQHLWSVASMVTEPDERIVALLHDILEDTTVTADTIRNLFGDAIADAVIALTRRQDESYMDYIKRVSENPLAATVKIADLKHNMDLSRLPVVSDNDMQRNGKYLKALRYLERR